MPGGEAAQIQDNRTELGHQKPWTLTQKKRNEPEQQTHQPVM